MKEEESKEYFFNVDEMVQEESSGYF